MPDTTPHRPTDKTIAEVAALRSFGHTHEEIARHIGICSDTLVKYYQRELDTAIVKANSQVANVLFKKCVEEEDLTAIMFWLKTRARWREKDPEDTKKYDSLVEKLVDRLIDN